MTNPFVEARYGEWFHIFEDMSQDLMRVFCATTKFIPTKFIRYVLQQEMEVLSGVHVYKVAVHSGLLQPMVRGSLFFGTLKRVRVCIKARTNDSLLKLFFGAIEDLGFDPSLWNWKGAKGANEL
jgi:hypothetical protein